VIMEVLPEFDVYGACEKQTSRAEKRSAFRRMSVMDTFCDGVHTAEGAALFRPTNGLKLRR